MIRIIDYYFYRSYTYPKERDVAFFRSLIFAWGVCFSTLAIPISAVLTLFIKHVDQRIMGVAMFVFLYFRYKKKRKHIIAKFKNNKLDRYLPLFLMALLLPLLVVPCDCIGLKIIALLRENHLDGIAMVWLSNLFSCY